MKNYTDIFYQPGEEIHICYRSGLLVYEETLVNKCLVSSGYNTAGFPLDVLVNCPSRIYYRRLREPAAFKIEINGQNVDNCWKFLDFKDEETQNGHIGTLTLENEMFDVEAKIYTVLDGTQMLSRYYEFTNKGNTPLNISKLSLLSGPCETMEKAKLACAKKTGQLYEMGYFDADNWAREGQFNWHPMNGDCSSFAVKYDRDRFRHPVMFLKNNVTGTMFFSQIAWTGGCRFSADLNATDERDGTILSLDLELDGYRPLYVLKKGETLKTPEIIFGMITGGLDEAVNEMNAHIRKSVLTMPEASGDALLVGCGMGAEHDMSVETSKIFMRQMKEMGGEVFIIDAGWECPPVKNIDWWGHNGKNVPDSDRYPNGLKELKDYATSIGMKLGLWMEPERLGHLSNAYHEHPEWFTVNYWGEKTDGYIDLTIPEAAKWVEDEIARVIEEYELDLFRVDHNGSPDYFTMKEAEGTGIKECQAIRHINAFYGIFRRLKKRFPDVIFENCAGGGSRTDLGMLKAFNHTWVSDWQVMPRSITITDGMTLALPPERVDRLFAGMNSHEVGSLALNMRNTMLGHMSLNVINPKVAEINTDAMAFVSHSVSLYKNFIRKFLPKSKIYHHTPEEKDALEKGYCATELVSEDRTKAVLHVATLVSPEKSVYCIHPKGLDRSKKYKVTFDNTGDTAEVGGFTLMNEGLRLVIPSALMSELVIFEEK